MFLAAITIDFILLHILCLQVYAGLPDRRRHGPRSIYSYMEDLHKVIVKTKREPLLAATKVRIFTRFYVVPRK